MTTTQMTVAQELRSDHWDDDELESASPAASDRGTIHRKVSGGSLLPTEPREVLQFVPAPCENTRSRRAQLQQVQQESSSPPEPPAAASTPLTEASTNSSCASSVQETSNTNSIPKIEVGTRLEVFWDGENEYFAGTIQNLAEHQAKCWFVAYDDGDQHWINPHEEVYRLLSEETNQGESEGKDGHVAEVEEAEPGEEADADVREEQQQLAAPTPAKEPVRAPKMAATPPRTFRQVRAQDFWADDFDVRNFCDIHDDDFMKVEPTTLARKKSPKKKSPVAESISQEVLDEIPAWLLDDVHIPISEKVKLGRRRSLGGESSVVSSVSLPRKKIKLSAPKAFPVEPTVSQVEQDEQRRRNKESARALTAAEIREILGDDVCLANDNWVRRSVRQPCRSALNSPLVKALLEKLRSNDSDMVVLKMKQYVSDPNAPLIVIDAALDALEDNTNCEALYIQNFNEGMRDAQVLRLLEILQQPSCNIWCLNIGETYKVKRRTWKLFAKGLAKTKVTHMYASEHTISQSLKELVRNTIRDNRRKHNRHIDPDNLDTIVRCTHCWWNPINAKVLRPFLRKRGYEHMLHDKEVQGLPGSTSGATLK